MSELDKLIQDKPRFQVLIVDDKANMRRTVRNMLRALGFSKFDEAEDGAVAIRKIKTLNLDLIICDWNMPRMNGLDVLRFIRENRRTRDIPFIMITAEVEEGTIAESIEAEVDGYILKPFVPGTLEGKIVEILKRKLNPSPVELSLRQAENNLDAGDYDAAHSALDQAAQVAPRSPRLHYLRGLVYESQGDLQAAEESYLRSRQAGPKFIKAHEKLADLYARRGENEKQLKVLKEAVRVSPKNADRQTKLGQALLNEGRIQEAKKAFGNAVKLDPNNAERKTAIGEAYLSQGLSEEAENAFRASIEVDPGNIYVYNRLGIAFRRQKKFNEAIQYYHRALEINPEEENILYNLARAYLGTGDKNKAIQALQTAIRLHPGFVEAHDLLAKISE
jgi:CheY-like chemotaxis protein